MKSGAQLAAVILAAGASSRMGRPKPLLSFEGATFLDRQIACFSGICEPIIVVLGYCAEDICAGIERAGEVEIAINAEPERGMLSSLQCGLSRLPRDIDAALFTPVDLPCISRSTVQALAGAEADFAVPVFHGSKGHPVRVSRAVIDDILALPPAAQARDALSRHRLLRIDVDDPGILVDVDTPAEYDALIDSLRTGARV